MPSDAVSTPSSARPGPAPARPGPVADHLDPADLDHEVRRLVEQAEGLKLLEGLALGQADDPVVWRRLAAARFDVGDRRGAVRALRRAGEIAPACREVETDLRAVGSHVVPDWHFAMLGDRVRNRAYRDAIDRAVGPATSVLELGAGSGLLSMFAARAGARQVTACEVTGVLADTATDIVSRNGFADRVTVVDCHSSALEVGPHLPERADVLVSELLDPTLLAEGVLPSVRDARARLLKPDGVVLPARALVWAVLLEAPARAGTAPVGSIDGLDLSPMETLRDPDRSIVTRLAGEPVRFLTEPFAALEIDLASPGPTGVGHRSRATVEVSDRGTVHGVGWWFELWLDDTVSLSTGPAEARHWPQVLQLSRSHRPVDVGDLVVVTASHDDTRVGFSI
jgi:type II protein arginine methyltransferase